MSNRIRSAFILSCACAALAAVFVLAGPRASARGDEKPDAKPEAKADAKPEAKADAKAEAKPAAAKAYAKPADARVTSVEEQMAQWEKAARPGKQHERLKALAGEFDADIKCYMTPDGPQSSKGKETSEMVMGGRFLASQFEGQMFDKPFTGKGMFGYDNLKKKYVSTWVDSMSTGIMYAEGTADDSGKVFTLHSEMTDPSGKTEKMKLVTTILDDEKHTFQMLTKLPDGGEFKAMEITYTRVK